MKLKTPSDIPSDWPRLTVQKNICVSIRPSNGVERFSVSWQDSELISDPEMDIIINNNGTEYPCKKDIFSATYQEVGPNLWRKTASSIIVRIPEGQSVEIETLEGTLNAVSYPDYIAIGAKGELYANSLDFVNKNLVIL